MNCGLKKRLIKAEAGHRKHSNRRRIYRRERINMIWWNMQQPRLDQEICDSLLCCPREKTLMNGLRSIVSILSSSFRRSLAHSLLFVTANFLSHISAVDFFNQINMLYGTITEFCTEESCPIMSAGPKYEYHWADGHTVKKPIKCSAPKYIDYLMTWVQDQLDDETLFPSKIGKQSAIIQLSVCKV